ncbi:hypothetical protein KAR48_10700 [bacterium]|nr:hypothetical protein [bacterium]
MWDVIDKKPTVRRLFTRLKRPSSKITVWALVGKAGTGKSFRAKLVQEKHSIDLLIDDGLLIKDQRILAGRSAKREKNRSRAVKRAIFHFDEHAKEVRDVLLNEKFNSILVLGTSERMAGLICQRLDLPLPDEIITIHDIASPDEIARARDHRENKGQHIIPVPVIEIKKEQPDHRVVDSIRFFMNNHSLLRWKNKTVEKAIVQPPFSRMGRLSISDKALSQMIMHCVAVRIEDAELSKITINHTAHGYDIAIRLALPYGVRVPDKLADLQQYVASHVERYSGIHIDNLDITVSEFLEQMTK